MQIPCNSLSFFFSDFQSRKITFVFHVYTKFRFLSAFHFWFLQLAVIYNHILILPIIKGGFLSVLLKAYIEFRGNFTNLKELVITYKIQYNRNIKELLIIQTTNFTVSSLSGEASKYRRLRERHGLLKWRKKLLQSASFQHPL